MSSKNKSLNLNKDELYELYINQRWTSQELANKYNCSSKCIRNYLKKFNIPIRSMGESVKLERSKWTEEKERLRSLRFMNTWNSKSVEEKESIMSKSRNFTNTPEALEKARKTRLKNKTYNKSIAEDDLYHKLIIIFGKDDVIRQYKDDIRYPFNCDFYIKSKDLFIELQGHWTHYSEPYNEHNLKHLQVVDKWKKENKTTKVWVERDVIKLNTAKENNLNYMLIYLKHNTYILKNKELINLGKFNIVNINDID